MDTHSYCGSRINHWNNQAHIKTKKLTQILIYYTVIEITDNVNNFHLF